MPRCCNNIHVGWICPICGEAMAIKTHMGNEPVSVKKIQNVTIVQGDLIKGSVIKDSVVMGNVASENIPEELVSEGGESSGDIIEDSIVLDLDEQVLTEPEEPQIDLDYVIPSDFSKESNDLFDV
tara:strand:+ start:2475 stop:2849 length:375 start_codon:yes stop_codon:yes gene_type:complete